MQSMLATSTAAALASHLDELQDWKRNDVQGADVYGLTCERKQHVNTQYVFRVRPTPA